MADYTFAQLEGLWIQAGGPRTVAPVAAAIALAESSGNPGSINRNDPLPGGGTQTAWGLWQIANGTHNMPEANILDPMVNAKAAVAKFHGASDTFGPWGTYATGAFTHFLPKGYQAPAAVNPTSSGSGGSSLTGDIFGPIDSIGRTIGDLITKPLSVASGLSSIAHDFGVITSTLNTMLNDALWLFKPGNWIRVMCFAFGIMFLLPGIWMLSKAGSGQGDISLALGIGLVMVAGMLLFLAFHNLGSDVTDIKSLLGHISSEIRSNSPATTG